MDFDYEEECEGSGEDILADEYPAAVDQGAFQLGFGSSKAGHTVGKKNVPMFGSFEKIDLLKIK